MKTGTASLLWVVVLTAALAAFLTYMILAYG